MSIAGKYLHVRNDNVADYMVANGLQKNWAEAVDQVPMNLEIDVDGDRISITLEQFEYPRLDLVLGQEMEGVLNAETFFKNAARFDEDILNLNIPDRNVIVKILAKLEGNTLTVRLIFPAFEGIYTFEFSDSELILTTTYINKDVPPARRIYVRLE